MKIAYILGQFPSLSETFILNQITGMIDLGHTVKIFALNRGDCTKVHSDINKYQLLDSTYYFDIPYNKVMRIYKAIKIFLKHIYKYPEFIVKSLNFFKYKKLAISLRLLFYIEPFLKESFDIIHCHFGPIGSIGCYIKDIINFQKLIVSIHGYDITVYDVILKEQYYHFLFKKSDLILSNTYFTKNKIVELGCDAKKIIVHPVGLDIKRFHFKERKNGNLNKIKFLTIGRLVGKKGHKFSIEAFSKVLKKNNNIEYIIVGDGPLKGDLYKLASILNLYSNIKFTASLIDEECVKLYSKCQIFVLASITAKNGDMEGQGLVLQEAQACGMPVISTFHNGIPEGVLNGKSGFLVPEKDVNALAEKMEYLINHSELWPEIGRAGRRFVEEKYDIVKLNKRLEKIYEALINNNFSELESL